MRCQLHGFIHKTEDNARHPINYCTSIRKYNDTVCAEKYCIKIIMDINSYFICTNFWKIFCKLWFQYCSILGDNDNDYCNNYKCNFIRSLIE